jgi:hypothetical protein
MPAFFEFGLNARDLVRLRKFFLKSPKQFAIAARNVINEMAFEARRQGFKTIDRQMTVRNPKFVKGSLWVDLQRGNPPLRSVQSEFGSIRRKRFTGWEEQETGRSKGSRNDKFRQATLEARLGIISKQMTLKARMKPGPPIPSSRTRVRSQWRFADTPNLNRATMMLIQLSRENFKGPFIIDDNPKFPTGLYRFKGRKAGRKRIRLMQLFATRKPRVRRVKWLSGAAEKVSEANNLRELWGRAVRRALPKRLR